MKKTIIILHGWGLFGKKYEKLQNILEKKGYHVFSPDMPGFGQEPLVKDPMTITDYVSFVMKFMKQNNIKKAIFIGHSFGGRVIAKLAVLHPELVEKIIFTGSPLIRQKLSFKKMLVQKVIVKGQIFVHFAPRFLHEFIRYVIYRFIVREFDYYKANKLRETLKNIINENSSNYISQIKAPTLVLWGEEDKLALLVHGQKIAEVIPGAQFAKINNAGHGIPYTHPNEFAQHVLKFINQ